MVHFADPKTCDSQRSSSRESLELRVRGTNRDGQVIKLHSTKCTIGSGSECTLRLRARGVHSLHCMIIRGERQSIIRRWSSDTLLNGATFEDSILHEGDLLTCGPIQLEVISGVTPEEATEPNSQESFDEAVSETCSDAEFDQVDDLESLKKIQCENDLLASKIIKQDEQIDLLTSRLSDDRRLNHQRIRKLIGQSRQLQTELSDLQQSQDDETQQAQAVISKQQKQLETDRQLLHTQQEQHRCEVAKWEQAKDENLQNTIEQEGEQLQKYEKLELELKQEIEKREADFAELETELQEKQKSLEIKRQDFTQQQQAIEEQHNLLKDEQVKLELQKTEFENEKERAEKEKIETEKVETEKIVAENSWLEVSQLETEELEQQLEDLQRQREKLSDELSTTREELEKEQQLVREKDLLLQQQAKQWQEKSGTDSSSDQPSSIPETSHQKASPQEVPNPFDAPDVGADSAPREIADDSELSVEQYMLKLLQRTSGRSESESSVAGEYEVQAMADTTVPSEVSPSLSENSPSTISQHETETLNHPEGEIEMDEKMLAVDSFIPKHQVSPNSSNDMQAMRDLANSSTHEALHLHQLRHGVTTATSKIIFASLAVMVGGCLLYFAPGNGKVAFYGGICALGIAGFWLLQSFLQYSAYLNAKRVKPLQEEMLSESNQSPADDHQSNDPLYSNDIDSLEAADSQRSETDQTEELTLLDEETLP